MLRHDADNFNSIFQASNLIDNKAIKFYQRWFYQWLNDSMNKCIKIIKKYCNKIAFFLRWSLIILLSENTLIILQYELVWIWQNYTHIRLSQDNNNCKNIKILNTNELCSPWFIIESHFAWFAEFVLQRDADPTLISMQQTHWNECRKYTNTSLYLHLIIL